MSLNTIDLNHQSLFKECDCGPPWDFCRLLAKPEDDFKLKTCEEMNEKELVGPCDKYRGFYKGQGFKKCTSSFFDDQCRIALVEDSNLCNHAPPNFLHAGEGSSDETTIANPITRKNWAGNQRLKCVYTFPIQKNGKEFKEMIEWNPRPLVMEDGQALWGDDMCQLPIGWMGLGQKPWSGDSREEPRDIGTAEAADPGWRKHFGDPGTPENQQIQEAGDRVSNRFVKLYGDSEFNKCQSDFDIPNNKLAIHTQKDYCNRKTDPNECESDNFCLWDETDSGNYNGPSCKAYPCWKQMLDSGGAGRTPTCPKHCEFRHYS